ncbi:MAG: alpha-hydroxy-acid oxidizing protein [Rhodobacteraceae bacterium]|nr:alpha-hydroxy-acid oxidizing protein [Paracoccaceae bacterium]
MDLDFTYPEVEDLRRRARRKMPLFAFDYLDSGTGRELGVVRNRTALDAVRFLPASLKGKMDAELEITFMGQTYSMPIGVAPIGMSGMIWPGAEQYLAKNAAEKRLPYCLSTVATKLPELIGPLAGDMGWFQLYTPAEPEVRRDILRRARAAGFTKLVLTVDVPAESRRERQRRAHVAAPPRITPKVAWEIMTHPEWALKTLRMGRPGIVLTDDYLSPRQKARDRFMNAGRVIRGFPDWTCLAALRDEWKGDLLVKGVMDPDDAKRMVEAGVDGIWVSNHGARQFDAAPASITQLPKIRAVLGPDVPIVFDSGVRCGLDVMRAIALGADLVMMGRAWHYAVGALDHAGPAWLCHIMEADLRSAMAQIGAVKLSEITARLVAGDGGGVVPTPRLERGTS